MTIGWDNFPPTAAQATANSWIWHDQIRQALLEKVNALNISYFPLVPQVWAAATITAQGIDGRGWYVDFTPAMTCNNFDPSIINTGEVGRRGNVDHFAAVVNDPDPKKCVRLGPMDISNFPEDHGATSTRLYLVPPPANDPDYLDYAAVVGKQLVIITGYGVDEDPWWSERWMQPPNNAIVNRKVSIPDDSGLACSPGFLIDTTIGDKSTTYAGQHLWIGIDRFRITAVDDHSITFANPNIDPLPTLSNGDPYVVIHAEGFYKPDNEFFCWRWHDVINDAWYAHDHTLTDAGPTGGQVGTANLRATTVRMFNPGLDGVCPTVGEPTDITEHDVWVGMPNWCDDPNTTKTPHIYRTIRGCQLATWSLAPSFVENKDYSGSQTIPQFVAATWFVLAGINVVSLSGTSPTFVTDHWEVDVNGADFDAFPDGALDDDGVFWALLDTTWGNKVLASGRAYAAADIPTITVPVDIPRTAAADPIPFVPQQENVTSDPYELGTPHSLQWVCSLGFTRKHPQEFRYAYERSGFVPEIYTVTVGDVTTTTLVADPPTSDHPGTYDSRPASDHLTRADLHGAIQDSTFDYDEIEDGMLARYLGDNQNDPGLTLTDYTPPSGISRNIVQVESGDHTDGTLGPRLWYADQFREMEDFQGGFEASGSGASGAATTGGKTFITDAGKSWWPQGSLIVHSGTAADGGATGLTAPASDGFWAQTIDGHGRFVGMAVEVNTQGDVWEKRFITFHSGTNISWVEPLSVLAGGKPFRIAEPRGRKNYWKGRTVSLTSRDGVTKLEDVPIIGSDNDTIYFDAQDISVGPGWNYSIYEMLPGAVYARSEGEWVLPAEADDSDIKSKNVHPDTLTRYGFARKRDYVNAALYSELRTGLDLLSATPNGAVTWIANGETNHHFTTPQPDDPEAWFEDDNADTYTNVTTYCATSAATLWGFANHAVTTDGEPPSVANSGYISVDYMDGSILTGYSAGFRVGRTYAYGHKTDLPTLLAGSVDLYTFSTIPASPFGGDDPDAYGGVFPLSTSDGYSHMAIAFNAYGDAVQYHKWVKSDTQTISSNVTTIKIGSDAQPASNVPTSLGPPTFPPTGTGLTENINSGGYQITATQTVCRWNMKFHA